jgi:hypothetical protein
LAYITDQFGWGRDDTPTTYLAFLELTDPPPPPQFQPPPPPRTLTNINSALYGVLADRLPGLAASVTLNWTRSAGGCWIRWEVEELVESTDGGDASRHRLFELSRTNGTATTVTVTELPITRLVRGFTFDATGLPPPDLADDPAVWEQNTATTIPADTLAAELTTAVGGLLPPERLAQLTVLLRQLAPYTAFELPAATSVTVEERDAAGPCRWSVAVAGNDHFRSSTVRRVGVGVVAAIRVDPPGRCCRYGSRDYTPGTDNATDGLLRADLKALGLAVPSAADLREAVREFQVTARGTSVARLKPPPAGPLWRDRLEPYTLSDGEAALYRYTGPANGVVTNETAGLIDHWLSERAQWASPVVFEVYGADGQVVTGLDNVWSLAEADGADRRVRVTDLTAGADRVPLASYDQSGAVKGWLSRNVPGFEPCAAAAELTQVRVYEGEPDAASDATYPLFRAVMDRTCGGHLDGIDARFPADGFLFAGAALTGPLGAILALARDTDRAAGWLVESEGWQPKDGWHPDAGARRGRSSVWADQFGRPSSALCPESQPFLFDKPVTVPQLAALRHWHWYYRLVRAGRDAPEVSTAGTTTVRRHGYARAAWAYALALLGVLTRVPLRGDSDGTLGRAVTSQRCWAVLLYWYLRRPGDLVTFDLQTGLAPTNGLRTLVETARADSGGDPALFQAGLVDGLAASAASGQGDDVFKADVAALAGLAALSVLPNTWNESLLNAP